MSYAEPKSFWSCRGLNFPLIFKTLWSWICSEKYGTLRGATDLNLELNFGSSPVTCTASNVLQCKVILLPEFLGSLQARTC